MTKYNQNLLPEKFNEIELLDKILIFAEHYEANEPEKMKTAFSIAKIVYEEMSLGVNAYLSVILYVLLFLKKIEKHEFPTEFGEEIPDIFFGLQKIKSFSNTKYEEHLDNYIKLLLTATNDLQTIFIILAEQVYFLRNITSFAKDEQRHIISEIKNLYLQITHRLGLYRIKKELEESLTKFYHEDIYFSIQKKLDEQTSEREEYIKKFITSIYKLIQKTGYKLKIQGRTKAISSIWKKMQRQGVPFDEVYDLFAIRIIIDVDENLAKDACWEIYSLITEKYKSHPARLRDWISKPKLNGYSSLHATVVGLENKWLEVQIRTRQMHEVAENGLAAHWKYKEYSKKSKNKEDFFALIKNSLEKTSQSKKNKIKATLYSEEIFVFTPNGDLKKIPKGSTILDFAFLIHSSIGGKCMGAKVNDKYLSYKNVLKNGDSVKIVTSKKQKPKHDWLKIAHNSRTKKKIQQILRKQAYKYSVIGKELLQRKFKRLNKEFTDVHLNKLEKRYKCPQRSELFEGYGNGKFNIKLVKNILSSEKEIDDQREKREFDHEKKIEKKQTGTDNILYIARDFQSLKYVFAKCCNPIPGDKIYAFISITKGAVIHRKSCPNSPNILEKYPYRILKARWKKEIINFEKDIKLMLLGRDKLGIINEITNLISNDQKVIMKTIKAETDKKNNFRGYIIVRISNRKQLDNLINKLLKIEDIYKVVRIK